MLAEAFGGWFTNSLALIADAGHMLTDVAALSLTWRRSGLLRVRQRRRKTYGYYRLEILAAFINGIALVLISLWVIYEAYERWNVVRRKSKVFELTLIAVGGLIVNLICRVSSSRRPRTRFEYARRVASRHRRRARFGHGDYRRAF